MNSFKGKEKSSTNKPNQEGIFSNKCYKNLLFSYSYKIIKKASQGNFQLKDCWPIPRNFRYASFAIKSNKTFKSKSRKKETLSRLFFLPSFSSWLAIFVLHLISNVIFFVSPFLLKETILLVKSSFRGRITPSGIHPFVLFSL